MEITKGENANLAGMEPRCPKIEVVEVCPANAPDKHSVRVNGREIVAFDYGHEAHSVAGNLRMALAQFFRSPAPTPPLDVISKQLQKVFDYFMGPNACGDFTCNCNKPEVCGVCEIRLETASLLRRHIASPAPQVRPAQPDTCKCPYAEDQSQEWHSVGSVGCKSASPAAVCAMKLCGGWESHPIHHNKAMGNYHSFLAASPAQPEKRDERDADK